MKQLAQVNQLKAAIRLTEEPAEVWRIGGLLDALETTLKASGIINEIMPCREARCLARWRFGQLLAEVERKQGRFNTSTGLTFLLKALGITRQTAMQAQHLGALPEEELEEAFAKFREHEELATFDALMALAKPYWYLRRRSGKHQDIQAKAQEAQAESALGPFPLLYADPPWVFKTYTPKGRESHRMPDDHYPTMGDEELAAFTVGGVLISELAHKDAALFMWATSSNLKRALAIMDVWGFTFKTCAVWDKQQIGLGLIFRNQHELLLYGDRGKMPKPVWIPPSVFSIKRTAHSRKPPEVRQAIERMYPHFDASTRAELFSRGGFDGWTCFGNEAGDGATGRSGQAMRAVG